MCLRTSGREAKSLLAGPGPQWVVATGNKLLVILGRKLLITYVTIPCTFIFKTIHDTAAILVGLLYLIIKTFL